MPKPELRFEAARGPVSWCRRRSWRLKRIGGRIFLAPILAVRIVANVDEAIEHIGRYGSGHTDAIVTENLQTSRRFLREVDSSSVMVNASTQFPDGFEYGLGAKIWISTNKLQSGVPWGWRD
ncbi:MAG: hypothetical protein Ct9H300mP13_4040 [Gammaproteobacteria bacterium]|nr:MAG: hypothetical protein Ct9H300mP13_4040 [Gammaproteobacteria bacterium]